MSFDAAFHRGGIGSSDIAAIVGLSTFKGPWAIYMDKTGHGLEEAEDEAQSLGHALEPVVLQLYAERNAVQIRPGFNIQHPKEPWRRAQADGEVDGYPIGLEAKTAGLVGFLPSGLWGDDGTDQIPQVYLCQAHWLLSLKPEWETVHVPALIGGKGFCIYGVERHQEFETWLVEQGRRFWLDHVVKREPPEVDASQDCAHYLATIHPPKEQAEWLESSPAIDALAADLQRVSGQIKVLEQEESLYRNRFRFAIGDAKGIKGEWGLVYGTKPTKQGGARRLITKWRGEPGEEPE